MHSEERIATESDEERLTYISGLNQSVFATVLHDTSSAELNDIMETVSYDDAGNTVDMIVGFGYNGERLDESGNIYLRARYYNPKIGQFIQIDLYRGNQGEPETQQRYTYCANNQYKYTDPSGHLSLGLINGVVLLGKAIGAAVAGVVGVVTSVSFGTAAIVGLAVGSAAAIGIGIGNTIKNKVESMDNAPTIDIPKAGTTGKIDGGNPTIDVIPSRPTVPTLKVPQPCPKGLGWEQLPKNVIAAIGMSAWINEVLPKLRVSRKYKTNQIHHIIAKNAWSACGSVPHDFYLDVARSVVVSHFQSVDNLYNFAYMNNGLHRRIHTKLYYQSIEKNFPKSLATKTLSNKGIVRARLLNYKIILEGLSYLAI